MRILLSNVHAHLQKLGWATNNEFDLLMVDKFNIKAFFATKEDYTCFFTITNNQDSYLIYKTKK